MLYHSQPSQNLIVEHHRKDLSRLRFSFNGSCMSIMKPATGKNEKLCILPQVIRARAKEAVKRAKDGFDIGFSSQVYGQYSTPPIDDAGDLQINRRKKPMVDIALFFDAKCECNLSNSYFTGHWSLQIKRVKHRWLWICPHQELSRNSSR
jgi:hypothetical protein